MFVEYSRKNCVSLELSSVDISQLCNEAESSLCVVKVPFNFDFLGFIRRISSRYVVQVRLAKYFLLVVSFNCETDPGESLRKSYEFQGDTYVPTALSNESFLVQFWCPVFQKEGV